MNKKVKWGLIAFIACGLVVWGVYSQLPKLNSELAQADKVESGDKAKYFECERTKSPYRCPHRRIHSKRQSITRRRSRPFLRDIRTSRRDWVQRRKPRHQRPITCQGKRQAITGRIETLASPTQTGQ